MQANSGKFQAIDVGKKTFEKFPVFRFQSVNITCEKVVKLLGRDIDFNLSFDQHVSNICKKAAHQSNVMRRIGQNLSLLNRLTIFFHTFVLSNFNFCPLGWHFCTESNTKNDGEITRKRQEALGLSIMNFPHRMKILPSYQSKTFNSTYKTNKNYGH